MVNHLGPLLHNSISENQSAFIPNCLITDNALIAFECIHAILDDNSDRSNFCVYMLDMAKEYDRVDWSYLENVLVKLGFHRKWVQLVMRVLPLYALRCASMVSCWTPSNLHDGATLIR